MNAAMFNRSTGYGNLLINNLPILRNGMVEPNDLHVVIK